MQLPKNSEQSKATVLLLGGLVVIVLVIVIAGKFFGGISGALEGLGLKDSKEGKDNQNFIDSEVNKANRSGTNTPWSPHYYKQFPGAKIFTVSDSEMLAKQIWDSVGYLYDTPSKGAAAIKQCKTKTQVSFLAKRFYEKYGKDLLNWLNDKYDVMGQREYLRGMIDYVNSLPKYKV